MSPPKHKPGFHERRRAERTRVIKLNGRLELYLYLEDRRMEALGVRDVSPFGICVLLLPPIADDAYARLTYQDGEHSISVDGTVVWRRRAKAAAKPGVTSLCYWAGIFLHPWRIDTNLDFYAAIAGRISATRAERPEHE